MVLKYFLKATISYNQVRVKVVILLNILMLLKSWPSFFKITKGCKLSKILVIF